MLSPIMRSKKGKLLLAGRMVDKECKKFLQEMSEQMDGVVEGDWINIQNIPKQVIGHKLKKTMIRARTQVMRRTLQTQA